MVTKQELREDFQIYRVTTSGKTALTLTAISARRVITSVGVVIERAATRSAGAVDLLIGDSSDDDGFIKAASALAAANTIYGNTPEYLGEYLAYEETVEANTQEQYSIPDAHAHPVFITRRVPYLFGKVYSSADAIYLKLNQSVDLEAILKVFVRSIILPQ